MRVLKQTRLFPTQMNKANHLLLPLALAILGISIVFGHPDWGTMTGLVMVLLAAGLGVGELSLLSEKNVIVDKRGPQKISNSLVTLSSAAILAVYLAGYQRTGSAAARYEQQDARIRASESFTPRPPSPAPAQSVVPERKVQTAPPRPTVSSQPQKSPRKSSSDETADLSSPSPNTSEDRSATGFAPTAIRPPDDQPKKAVPAVTTPRGTYKDGTYTGWGTSRHGDIQASVVIESGQIVSADIAKCLTRYPCSWIIHLPDQVVTRQSTEINFVSGATESSDAFFEAVAQALTQARE